LPSGGDWALQKQGAITVVGTQSVTIADCLLTRLDGNAVFLGGFNRNTTIVRNEFSFIGDSAMAAWGDTSSLLNENGTHSSPLIVSFISPLIFSHSIKALDRRSRNASRPWWFQNGTGWPQWRAASRNCCASQHLPLHRNLGKAELDVVSSDERAHTVVQQYFLERTSRRIQYE
jgi:hypothetical protein